MLLIPCPHCGDRPEITWRHFTGEEPGIWTGDGRF